MSANLEYQFTGHPGQDGATFRELGESPLGGQVFRIEYPNGWGASIRHADGYNDLVHIRRGILLGDLQLDGPQTTAELARLASL